jgi:sulfur dioxygenase
MKNLDELSIARPEGFRDVLPEALFAEGHEARIIDVREPNEFRDELGHIRGAELVPLGTLGAAASHWGKSEWIVVVCRSGRRSEQAARVLASAGFHRVTNLVGGMMAWNAAKLPIE